MKNLYKVLFSTLFSAFIAFPNFTHAADQVVTTNADDGAGSLRQAIADVGDGESITFNLSTGNETITVLSELDMDFWPAKTVTVDGDNTDGSGVDITVKVTTTGAGGSTYRLFQIGAGDASDTITLTNITLQGGDVSGQGSGDRDGGVIRSSQRRGNITLDNVTIEDAEAARGGAMYVIMLDGTLTITNSTIQNCRADGTWNGSGAGGAIWIRATVMNITSSTIDNNTNGGNGSNTVEGAGLYIYGGTTTLDKTTISNNQNQKESGGGLHAESSPTVTITNSTFHGNSVTGDWRTGAGISIYGDATITNTTVFNNTASNAGGGMALATGTITLTNVTVANNSASDNSTEGDGVYFSSGTVHVKNSLFANNGIDFDEAGSGTVTDNGYNLVENSESYDWEGTGDIIGDQDSLNLSASLADNATLNGTQTLALSAGSVAIDAGNGTANNGVSIPTTDQRGLGRVATVDIGAFEQTDVTDPTADTLSPADDAPAVATTSNLVITFSEAVDAETGGNITLYKSDDTQIQVFDVTSDISGSGGTAITIDPTADLAEQTHCIRNPNWPRIINGTNYSGRITAKPLNKPHIQSTRSLGRFNGDMVSDNFV